MSFPAMLCALDADRASRSHFCTLRQSTAATTCASGPGRTRHRGRRDCRLALRQARSAIAAPALSPLAPARRPPEPLSTPQPGVTYVPRHEGHITWQYVLNPDTPSPLVRRSLGACCASSAGRRPVVATDPVRRRPGNCHNPRVDIVPTTSDTQQPATTALPKDESRTEMMRRVKRMSVEERLDLFERLSRDAAWAKSATRLR